MGSTFCNHVPGTCTATRDALSSGPVDEANANLGDLPSRLIGWAGKARIQGRDRIELDLATVDRIIAALRSKEPLA